MKKTYFQTCQHCGANLDPGEKCDCEEVSILNAHGKYVVDFAKNHGLTIAEAHDHPMIKAHLEVFNSGLLNPLA